MKRLLACVLLAVALAACDSTDDLVTGKPIERVKDGQNLSFGSIESVEGTRFVTIPIVFDEQDHSVGSFSKSYQADNVRNRLIVDTENGDSRRVLPDERFQISDWIQPGSKSQSKLDQIVGDDQPRSKAVEIYVAVVRRPAIKSDEPPTYDVLAGRYDGTQQVWVERNIAGFQGAWLTPSGKLAMLLARGDHGEYRLFDPVSFKPLLGKDLRI